MILTNSSIDVLLEFHPNNLLAFDGSPNKVSTSAGLKYFGSTSINTLPVFLHFPISSTPLPSHTISIPTSLKDN